jgi:hypothetical protein
VLRGETGELTLERVFAPMPPPAAPDSSIDMGGTPPVDRANYTYRADAKGEIDKAKADQVVGAVASLYAAEILDPSRSAADLGLAPPKRVAEVTMKDGTTTRILFGNPATDENRFYFQLEGGKPAEINKAAVERIFPDRKSLSPGAA